MITFNTLDVTIDLNKKQLVKWLTQTAKSESKFIGQINYVFCSDQHLLAMNIKHLNHDTFTDIITFDNSIGDTLGADIYISIDRVKDNSITHNVSFDKELLRVLVHGILHLCGFKDKSVAEAQLMRSKEDEKIAMFHVER